MDRKALKNWLKQNSTTEELEEIKRLEEKEESGEKLTKIEKQTLENGEYYKKMIELLSLILSSVKKERPDNSQNIISKLEELGGTITTSYEKNKPENVAPVYKDIINQLSAVKESIDKKPVPVWSWPQYAGVNVRDRNFHTINPATDGLDLGDYDYVSLAPTATSDTYTFYTGGVSGKLQATVVINYTDNTKTVLTNITKTPVTVQ